MKLDIRYRLQHPGITAIVAVCVLCSTPVFAGDVHFSFVGQLIAESIPPYDECNPLGNPMENLNTQILFTIPVGAAADTTIPNHSSNYYIDGSRVRIVHGENVIPVSELVMGIGRDYVFISIPEMNSLLMEFFWADGTFTGDSVSIFHDFRGAHKKAKSAKIQFGQWLDRDCGGIIIARKFSASMKPVMLVTDEESGITYPDINNASPSNPYRSGAFQSVFNATGTGISPRDLNMLALNTIETYFGYDLSDPWLDTTLLQTHIHVFRSLNNEFWNNSSTLSQMGKTVFVDTGYAVYFLDKISKRYHDVIQVKDAADESINRLEKADMMVSRKALEHALKNSDPDDELAQAEVELAMVEFLRAERESIAGNAEMAIHHLMNSWEHSQRALSL